MLLLLGSAEERLGGKRQEKGQKHGAKESVKSGHAPLHFIASGVFLVILLILQLLHHLEVENARNEQIEQRAYD